MSTYLRHAPGRVALGLLALMTANSACVSTAMVNMWRDPVYPSAPLQNLLVITLRKDGATRRIWEDGFVTALRAHGVRATPSYTIWPTTLPDTSALAASAREQHFDAVLVSHYVSSSTVPRWVHGYMAVEPAWVVGPWWRHYYQSYRVVYAPGYLESDRVVRYETEVWMTEGSGRLVWVGTTATINPTSSSDVNQEIADRIVPELLRQRIAAGGGMDR